MGTTAYHSWRSALADDAEWMSGKSRIRLAHTLDGDFLMDVGPGAGCADALHAPAVITVANFNGEISLVLSEPLSWPGMT